MKYKFIYKEVRLNEINIGDIILIDGVDTTIGKKDIKYCDFMGVSIKGASYPRKAMKRFKLKTSE